MALLFVFNVNDFEISTPHNSADKPTTSKDGDVLYLYVLDILQV